MVFARRTHVYPWTLTLQIADLTPMKGVNGKFKDEGYIGLLGFEVGVGFGTLPLVVRA